MSISDFAAKLDRIQLPWWVARTMSWVLALSAFVTGWDYLHTPETAVTAKSLKMVVQLATLHTWGIWFVVFASILTFGLLTTRHALVWLGHFGLFILFAGFAAATLQAVAQYEMGPETGQGTVWRAVTMGVMQVAFHGLLCIARGAVPRRRHA